MFFIPAYIPRGGRTGLRQVLPQCPWAFLIPNLDGVFCLLRTCSLLPLTARFDPAINRVQLISNELQLSVCPCLPLAQINWVFRCQDWSKPFLIFTYFCSALRASYLFGIEVVSSRCYLGSSTCQWKFWTPRNQLDSAARCLRSFGLEKTPAKRWQAENGC